MAKSNCPVCGFELTHKKKPVREMDKTVMCSSCTNVFEIVGNELIRIKRTTRTYHNYAIPKKFGRR